MALQVTGAFVTFNCAESAKRCLDDYKGSDSFLGLEYQPGPLKFRLKYPVTVTPAPDPVDIQWDNFAVSRINRAFRITAGYLLGAVLLCCTVAALVGLQLAASEYGAFTGPTSTQCRLDAPAVAYGTAAFPIDARLRYNASESCSAGSFSLRFHSKQQNSYADESVSSPLGGGSACLSRSAAFTAPVPASSPSRSFVVGNLIDCYCMQRWEDEDSFVIGFIILQTSLSSMCGGMANKYAVNRAFALAQGVVVVVMNAIAVRFLKRTGAFERHVTFSAQLLHTTIKLFLVLFLNTAFAIQLVNTPTPPSSIANYVAYVLRGSAPIVSLEWYSTVGPFITVTLVFHFGGQLLAAAARRLWFRCVRPCRMRRAISQFEMDSSIAPSTFNLPERTAALLVTVFVAVLYSSALPALVPLAFANLFLQYWLDKVRHQSQ